MNEITNQLPKIEDHGIKRNREIILLRREKVLRLYLVEKLSLREIARELDYDLKTIWNDLQYVKKQLGKTIGELELPELVKEIKAKYDRCSKVLWECYYESDIPINRARIANMVRKNDSEFLTDLQKLHILAKPVERQEVIQTDYKFEVIIDGKSINSKKKRIKNNPVEANTKTS